MVSQARDNKGAQESSRDRGRVLLITDDDPTIYCQALEATGAEIVGVSSGAAALVSLQKSRPHVVVASVSGKGLSENELARTLRRVHDDLPLIVAGVERATVARRHDALVAGAFDYFEIPAELPLLIERTKQLVQLRQKLDQLASEADIDPLTGLANRRRFRHALAKEVERWRRYGVPCALLMLDIDHLKAINDRYGHISGDLAIRQVGLLLDAVSRNTDTAVRLGGEEFALLLAGIDADKAIFAAERLRIALAERPVSGIGVVTVSIGVAACPAHADSERSLYSASDDALYVAKREGRNRVAVAPFREVISQIDDVF